LIEHILERFHQTHRRQLPVLIALAERVERTHAGQKGVPAGLSELLMVIAEDLETHQQKEECVLFPMMLAGGTPMIGAPITRMLAEHAEVEEQLASLRLLTEGFTPPAAACGAWRRLYEEAQVFHQDLVDHMRIENTILFPRFLPSP
jgi:regulator of cell morphogenesis and NO signaling